MSFRLFILLAASPAFTQEKTITFEHAVQPVLGTTCVMCHNDRMASGGLNVNSFLKPASLVERRDGWEKIIRRIQSGEMPPKGIPRPPSARTDALVNFIESEFEKADRSTRPDPGRVVAHRLNRREYINTVRDLLGVDYHAEKDFPTDDSGYGFDNISTVLTISPLLMENYLNAAETIAARATGLNPPPKKPVEIAYKAKEKTLRRIDVSTIEAAHFVEWDGDYVLRIGLPGERGPNAKPVAMGVWMDGELLAKAAVETRPSRLEFFEPYSEEQVRVTLPEGDHVFRIGFMDDDFPRGLSEKDAHDPKKNKFPGSVTFVGPFPSKLARSGRKIFVCDPDSGRTCVEKIVAALAHRAYRRPVTKSEVASLMKIAAMSGPSRRAGIQLAIEAMLVSPNFLFRIERDPDPLDASKVHSISDVELASRLSYFLWSSMPDDELLGLAESGKLHTPEVLDAQVRRMLADKRSAALAENFAGQWLEIRNLDAIQPDPRKFPEWGPELREAMHTETRMFFDHVLRENRPISDFLDGRYTFLNEYLAKFYGIEGVTGPDFRRVELATDQRGGILGHASVLAVSSYPTRTSVVIRGKYVLGNILGAPPPPPPPDVPPLDEGAVGTSASLRQQMERHRADATCASCHSRMDPLGFGLENYNAIGQWRTMDGKFPVDASGTFPNGKSFSTPAEMRAALASLLPQFSRCVTEKMLTYALGRGLESYDTRAVNEINRRIAASGYRFQSLIDAVVHSVPFQMGRGEAAKEMARR